MIDIEREKRAAAEAAAALVEDGIGPSKAEPEREDARVADP